MMNLSKLAEPFELDDIEWRVSRSGKNNRGIFCMVLAYITARAIQKRLDEVCGPERWQLEEPKIIDVDGKPAFVCGISILFSDEFGARWITKYDVCEPTNIEPAKGGFSGAMKRAGAQWGIGRYLYHLDETFAEVAEHPVEGSRNWNWARLSEKHGGDTYYWKTPSLPAWALPKDSEVSEKELGKLKRAWKDKFAPDCNDPKEMRTGFAAFVTKVVGEFPSSDHTCWTQDALYRVSHQIAQTTEPEGVDADVPFE